LLGEHGRYNVRQIEILLNSEGYTNPQYINARQLSDTQTIYEFSHEFEPWAGVKPKDQWTESDGYTLKVKAVSYNASTQENYSFYFTPFNFNGIDVQGVNLLFTFSVPKDHLQSIKENIDHFEIHIDNQKYLTNISPNSIDTDSAKVSVSALTAGVISQNVSFSSGDHSVKVVAVDKWGNSKDSNVLPVKLDHPIHSQDTSRANSVWFPLQVNKITGVNSGIISSFKPTSIKPVYYTLNLYPTFSGIAFSGSEVTLTVTDSTDTSNTKNYKTTVNSDSTFTIKPTLFTNSIISLTVTKDSLFSYIPSFEIIQNELQ